MKWAKKEEDVHDLSVVLENWAQHKSSPSKCVVLLTTGSLNPIHKGHVRQMERAKEMLEKQHNLIVLGGFISPSDASWAMGKAHGCLDNDTKLRLCQLALQGHSWLRVDSWELSQGMIDSPVVQRHMREVIHKATHGLVRVLYVCGADHGSKCGFFRKKDCCIVGRPGFKVPPPPFEAYFVPETDFGGGDDMSSTQIRAAMENGTLDTVKHMVDEKVLEELKKITLH